MPTVPYSPIPQPGQMVGTPKVSVNTPVAAFGGVVGQALEAAGKGIEHFGNETFHRAVALQELKNESEKSEAVADYEIKAGQLHADFQSLRGKDAVAGQAKYNKDLNELRVSIRDSLSNDMTRKMYDSTSLSVMGRSIFNGAGHAATQNKEWAKNSAASEIEANNNYIHQNPKDENALKQGLQKSETLIRGTVQHIAGWDDKQTDNEVAKVKSKALMSRITGLAKTEPAKAEEMLKQYRSQLYGDDIDRTENVVRNQMHSTGARVIGDKVMDSANLEAVEGKPADSLESLLKKGDELAKQQAPEDRQLLDYVRNQVHSAYNKRQQSIKDAENRNADMISNALQQFHPANLDELKAASPQLEGLINNMRPDKRLRLSGQITSYNASLRRQGNEDEFNRLSGMAESPEGREELLNTHDLGRFGLSQPQMNKIMNLQKGLRKDIEGDPRVNRAIGQFRAAKGSDLEALGIFRRTDQNKDDYDKFSGAMRQAIDTWVDVYKKAPTEKDIVDTIGPQITRQQVQSKWFGLTTGKSDPDFKQPVPKDMAEKIKKASEWLELPQTEQTEDRLKQVYNRLVFKNLFEAGIKKTQDRVGK